MQVKNIENDPYFLDWINDLDLRPSTIKIYLVILTDYCNLIGKTPTQLITEALEQQKQGIHNPLRDIKKYLTRFRQHLQEKEYSPKTIRSQITCIRGFYNQYEIDLPKNKTKKQYDEVLTTSTDLPDKEDIKKVIKHANFKYTAIIYLMLESGMGSAEIRSLKIDDFLKSLEIPITTLFTLPQLTDNLKKINKQICTWKIKRIKTGKPYFTFSGPDSINAIIDYLSHKYKNEMIDASFYLFGKEKALTDRAILIYFARMNDEVGFGFHGRSRFFTSHKLRKYFATTLEANRMPHLATRWLMGHTLDRTTGAYFKPDIDSLKMEYQRVLPYISISDVKVHEISTEDTKRLKELEEKVEMLKKYIELDKIVSEHEKNIE